MQHCFHFSPVAFFRITFTVLIFSTVVSETCAYVRARPTGLQAIQQIFSPVSLPSPPENLRVTGRTSASITLIWDAVPGAGSYNIYRSTLPGEGFLLSGSVIDRAGVDPVYTDADLVNQVTYYYNVTALTSEGEEGEVSGTISAMPALTISDAVLSGADRTYAPGGDAPLVLTAKYMIEGDTYLNRQAGNMISQVVYRLTTSPSSPWTYLADGQYMRPDPECCYRQIQSAFIPPPALGGTPGIYQYTFRFSSDLGQTWTYAGIVSKLENPGAATAQEVGVLTVSSDLDDIPPVGPTNFRITNIQNTSVKVEWDSGTDTDGTPLLYYDVYRSTEGAPATLSARVPGRSTSIIDYSLIASTNYAYTIRAVDDGFNYSPESDPQVNPPAQLTTLASPVQATVNITVPSFTPFNPDEEGIYLNHIISSSGTSGDSDWTATFIPCNPVNHICSKTFNVQQGAEFSFQVSRGSAQTVETTSDGHTPVPEHQFAIPAAISIVRNFTVQNWDDPLVISHFPGNGASPTPESIRITWNQVMPTDTVFSVEREYITDPPEYQPIYGTFHSGQAGTTITFTPNVAFDDEQVLRVSSGLPVDLKGIEQRSVYEWTFKTGLFRIMLPAIFGP